MLDVTTAVLACFLGIFGSLRLFRDASASGVERTGVVLPVFGILVASILKGIRTRKEESRFEPLEEPKEILGWAKGLHSKLCDQVGKTGTTLGVRIVVHRVIWNRRRTAPCELEQVMSYVGGIGGPHGRRTSARAGIIGRVARLAEPYFAKRQSTDSKAFRDELVGVWGFTEQEAHERSLDRWAWFALPLLQPDDAKPYGVVYLDSIDIGFFDDPSIRTTILTGCSILAATCAAVYNRKG